MKLFKFKKTKIEDIKKWLNLIFKRVELELSEHEVPENENTWLFHIGEIPIYIIIETSDPEQEHLLIHSVLCEIPHDNILPFYRKCLELNTHFYGATILLDETEVCLNQKRPIEYLLEDELSEMVGYHASLAEHVLKDLVSEFESINLKQ